MTLRFVQLFNILCCMKPVLTYGSYYVDSFATVEKLISIQDGKPSWLGILEKVCHVENTFLTIFLQEIVILTQKNKIYLFLKSNRVTIPC